MSYGSLVEFTFTDDPDWRAVITSIKVSNNGAPSGEYLHIFNTNTPGVLTSSNNYAPLQPAEWVWTFKATGYEDVVVTVVSQ